MTRVPYCVVVLCCVLGCSSAFGQTVAPSPVPRPAVPTGGTTGAQRPGLPPRDNPAARPTTGTSRLGGRVVSAETGVPLRRAQVSISGMGMQVRRAMTTDGEGRYEFGELPAGQFSINASKGGYVGLQYGQRRPNEPGTPVALAEGQALDRIDLALPRGAVVAGRVTDEFGDPLASAQVQVQRFLYGPDGQRRPSMAGMGSTDDRGEFRVFGLMPGEYIVNAGVRGSLNLSSVPGANDITEGYPPTYYPGTLNPAEAQTVSLAVGQEQSVHFSLLPSRMFRISGTVVDSEGRSVTGVPVMLRSPSAGGFAMFGGGLAAADGTFTISNVAPGEHVVEIRPQQRPGIEPEFASVPVVVGGGDITGLRIVTTKGATATGRVVFEGTAARRTAGPTPLRVMAAPADPTSAPMMAIGADPLANGTIGEDGSFQLKGLVGRLFLNAMTPPGWALKSVHVQGEDVTDEPYDFTGKENVEGVRIVLTDKLTNVSGQVTADRNAVRQYVVVIQPEQQREGAQAGRFIRLLRPDTNGRFETRGMRPGRYVATAVESIEQGRQFVPEFQRQLRQRGRAFEIDEGGTATLTLELASGL